MSGRREQFMVILAVLLAVTLIFNDLLALLGSCSGSDRISYIGRLVLLASIIIYVIYLKRESFLERYKLGLYRAALRQLSCGIAVYKNNSLMEVSADIGMFSDFGLSGDENGQLRPSGGQPADACNGFIRTESCCGVGGGIRYADRVIVPLTNFNGGGYTVEFLLDATKRELEFRRQADEYQQMFMILVNIFEMKDPYTNGHSEVVSNLSKEIARELGLEDTQVRIIGNAALFHDIGKIVVPPDIINKSGELEVSEYDIVRQHPKVGADILVNLSLFKAEAVIVRHHHERYDGKGYPDGLKGDEIPIGARIVAVADAFDAMTAGRSSKGKRDFEATLQILCCEK